LQTVFLATCHENSVATVQTEPLDTVLAQAASPRRKLGVKKKLTPKSPLVAAASQACPSSPVPIPEARRSWNYSENRSLFSFAPCHVMDSAYFVK
jgi:hypothetical protein